MAIFSNLFGIKSDSNQKEGDGYSEAGWSEFFPDFPLNPQNIFRTGETIRGKNLANISEIGLIICAEFEYWRCFANDKWPSYADKELTALIGSCNSMQSNVESGIISSVNSAKLQKIARSYVDEIRNSGLAYSKFMGTEWTLLNFSIDFANTIGCGGTLQAALQWYE